MDGVGDKNYTRYSGLIQYIRHPPTPYGTKGCHYFTFLYFLNSHTKTTLWDSWSHDGWLIPPHVHCSKKYVKMQI